MGNFGRDCKANAVLDVLMIMLIMIIIAIATLFGSKIFGEINTDIQNDPDINADAKNVSGNLYDVYNPLMDNLFMFAFVLLIIFVLVSVFFLDTHPIFFIITIVLLIFVFVVAMLLANSYDDIARDSELVSTANNLPYTTWLWEHMVVVVIGIAFLISMVMFIKFKTT